MKTGRIPEKKNGKPEKNCAADCGNRAGQTDGTYESPENPEIARRVCGPGEETGLIKNCGYTLIYRNGRKENRLEQVLTEHSLTIRICGGREIETVCTPRHLKELVAGRLYAEGVISSAESIQEIVFRQSAEYAEVRLIPEAGMPESGNLKDVKPGYWAPEWIFALADRFKEGMPLHDRTRAAHSCFLACGNRLLFQCEDIGRHNAADKVIGFALLKEIDPAECIIYSSGRIPADMAAKAIRAKIPVLVSKAAPTSEAVALAKEYGLTLIGAARSDSMRVYYDGRVSVRQETIITR